ncbi:MAG TPA: CDP-alcohol phosphatidyltransferase family protein [Gammaproteobacteria bacterium]|nr:CDP-alcohol phosphatidyltransferase family protein [Gammaproteobacteria bacterium]
MRGHYIPNSITFLRILLVAPLLVAMAVGDYGLALLLFVVAGGSDALDGFLAKRFHWESRLGAALDPLADKLLMVASYLMLGAQGHLPIWLVAVVIGRDAVILLGAGTYRLLFGSLEMAPRLPSKANTLLQIVLVAVVLLALCCYPVADGLRTVLVGAVLLSSLWSGLDYVWVWSRHAVERRKEARG